MGGLSQNNIPHTDHRLIYWIILVNGINPTLACLLTTFGWHEYYFFFITILTLFAKPAVTLRVTATYSRDGLP